MICINLSSSGFHGDALGLLASYNRICLVNCLCCVMLVCYVTIVLSHKISRPQENSIVNTWLFRTSLGNSIHPSIFPFSESLNLSRTRAFPLPTLRRCKHTSGQTHSQETLSVTPYGFQPYGASH